MMDVSMAQLVMNNENEWNYCDLCEKTNDPSWKCIVCNDVLCTNCKMNHLSARKTKAHKIISYQERNKAVYLPSNLYCKIHPTNRIILCCEECDIPVCDECVEKECSSHKLVKIKKIAIKKREPLVTDARSKVKSIEAKWMNNLTKLEKQVTEDAIENSESCDRILDICISALKDVSNSLKTEIKTRQEKAQEIIKTQRKIFNDQMQTMKADLSTYEQELIESDNYVVQHASEEKAKMKVEIPDEFETVQILNVGQENTDVKILDSFLQKCSHLSCTSNLYRSNIFVAGLHLGTYMSACSFSTGDINRICSIYVSGNKLMTNDSTSLLLKQNGQLHSYGEHAAAHYLELVSQDKHTGWYFFEHFPKELCGNEVPTFIRTTDGRMYEYLKIYTSVISYFKQQSFNVFKSSDCAELFEWVITVPSSAHKTANILIQNAAKLAGIQNEVMVIEEAEAISCYCREIPSDNLGGNELSFMAFMPGSKQLVVHVNSEMANLTVLEVIRNGRHKNIFTEDLPISSVLQSFEKCLRDVFGEKQASLFRNQYSHEYSEVMKEMKNKIRNVKYDDDRTVNIRVGPTLYQKFLEVKKKQMHSEKIQIKSNQPKLFLKPSIFKTFFDDCVAQIVRKVKSIEKRIEFKFIIMAGEMAESEILQRKIRCAVPSLTVLVTPDPNTAIIKGAILYGQLRK